MTARLIARKFYGFTHYSVGGVEWEIAHLSYAAEFPDWAEEAFALVNSFTVGVNPAPVFN